MKRTLHFFLLLLLLLLGSFDATAFTLVIDPGHGGRDSGALGRRSKEKDINLAVALAFGEMVKANYPDVKVIYTRKSDIFVELSERTRIANKAKADLFVSIHTNSLPRGKVSRGTETYTLGMHKVSENLEVAKRENSVITMEANYKKRYEGFDPSSSESYIIFEFIQDRNMEKSVRFAQLVQQQFASTAGRKNKGVYQAGFLVLRETSMPSALIELGYISTPDEESFLKSVTGQKSLAKSIFRGFKAYKEKL